MNERASSAAVPRHAEIACDLAAGIADGRFPVGSLLPTEFELCDRYATSRHTVRVALAELQAQGLVSRRRNVGTRVEAAAPRAAYRPSLASVDDLVQFGATHVRTVRRIKEVTADGALAAELACTPGAKLLRISSLRADAAAGGRPIGWTDVYVDAAHAGIGDLARASPDTLISSLIETHYGRRIARIRQDIQAAAMPAAQARELGVEPGSPALRIVRRYLDADDLTFEVSITWHPAERFTFSMELERSGGLGA